MKGLTKSGKLNKRITDYVFRMLPFDKVFDLMAEFEGYNPYPGSQMTIDKHGYGDGEECAMVLEKTFSGMNQIHFLTFEFDTDEGILAYEAYLRVRKLKLLIAP